jgi:hypothetical protein
MRIRQSKPKNTGKANIPLYPDKLTIEDTTEGET